jgi:hypothetical protein
MMIIWTHPWMHRYVHLTTFVSSFFHAFPIAWRKVEEAMPCYASNLPDFGMVAETYKTFARQCYPLVNYHSYGKSPFYNGKINYKWPCSIATLNYQRVNLNELTSVILGIFPDIVGRYSRYIWAHFEPFSQPKADPFQRLKPQDLRTFGDMVVWLPMIDWVAWSLLEQNQQEALRSFERLSFDII